MSSTSSSSCGLKSGGASLAEKTRHELADSKVLFHNGLKGESVKHGGGKTSELLGNKSMCNFLHIVITLLIAQET